MLELISDVIFMFSAFLIGMLWAFIIAAMAIVDPKHGERRSAWFQRKIEEFDAERKRLQWKRQRAGRWRG